MRAPSSEHARPRDVLTLAWPIMVSMASFSVMGLVDSVFVSRLGTVALASVGLASSALHLTTAFWIGVLGGARVWVSQASGADDETDARLAAWQGLFIAGIAGVLAVLTVPFGDGLLAWLGASAEAIEAGGGYLRVRLVGSVAVFQVFALQAWFQGRGDTRTPMRAVLVGNLLNVVLDPLLIHGFFGAPALGVTGAAVATVVAWVVQWVWLAWAGWRSIGRPPVPAWAPMRRLLDLGVPMGTHFVLDVAAFAVFTAMLASVGEAHVAAHVVVIRVLTTSFLPGHAIGQATGVLVGRSLGAGRPDVAREAWASGSLVAAGSMTVLGVLFVAIPSTLVAPFGVEPEVQDLASSVLMLAGLVQAFDALGMVGIGALNGAGDTRFSMIVGLALAWGVKVPLGALAVFGLGLGVFGAWLGVAAELVLLAMVAIVRVRGRAWLQHGAPASA